MYVEHLDKTYIESIVTKMKLLGVNEIEVQDNQAVYTIAYNGGVKLRKCLVIDGEYTIPEFVTSIYKDIFACEDKENVFDGCKALKLKNKSQLTSFDSLFTFNESIVELDLSEFDTSKVYTLANFLECCTNLRCVNFSNFNTTNCIDMSCMFIHCHSLKTIDLSSFDVSHVEDVENMFAYDDNLDYLDIRHFNFFDKYIYGLRTMFLGNRNVSKYLLPENIKDTKFFTREVMPGMYE